MIRSTVLAVTGRDTVRRLVTETTAGRSVAGRFVAGDHLEDAVAVVEELNAAGMSVSMDHLGEHVAAIDEAERATTAYLECLDAIESRGLDANISVKLTQLGMGLDDEVAGKNLERLAVAAAGAGTTVTVDMEESAHTDATIGLYESVQRTHGNLGIAVQSYLLRTASDLERLIPLGGHIRLCKGAYAESEEIAFQSHGDVDASFDRLSARLMASPGVKPAIATHDDLRIAPVIARSFQRDEPWEFQMLYGVRRDRQAELVAAGHAMRVYVPYGEAWYPYLTRRLAERPANLTFFGRALLGR